VLRGGLGDEVHLWWFRRGGDGAALDAGTLLREVCARYGDVEDAAVAYREGGQPFIPGSALACSLSHSGDLIVVAVAGREVGVDVEVERGEIPEQAFLGRTCTLRQRFAIRRSEPSRREAVFLRYWVRKEALGKALGVGLDLDLHPAFLMVAPTIAGRRRGGVWRVRDLDVEDGYAAAVATRGPTLRVRTIRRP
jgi:phosphopantetheinyl transferase